jgi:hypothetical protein
VDLGATAHSVGKAAQEESIEAILRFVHLSERIPSYYFIQCIHLFTFLDSVKAVLVHPANRLLSESTLILRMLRRRPG